MIVKLLAAFVYSCRSFGLWNDQKDARPTFGFGLNSSGDVGGLLSMGTNTSFAVFYD